MTRATPDFLAMIATEQYDLAQVQLKRYLDSTPPEPDAMAAAIRHMTVALANARAQRERHRKDLDRLAELQQYLGPRRRNVTLEEFG